MRPHPEQVSLVYPSVRRIDKGPNIELRKVIVLGNALVSPHIVVKLITAPLYISLITSISTHFIDIYSKTYAKPIG